MSVTNCIKQNGTNLAQNVVYNTLIIVTAIGALNFHSWLKLSFKLFILDSTVITIRVLICLENSAQFRWFLWGALQLKVCWWCEFRNQFSFFFLICLCSLMSQEQVLLMAFCFICYIMYRDKTWAWLWYRSSKPLYNFSLSFAHHMHRHGGSYINTCTPSSNKNMGNLAVLQRTLSNSGFVFETISLCFLKKMFIKYM